MKYLRIIKINLNFNILASMILKILLCDQSLVIKSPCPYEIPLGSFVGEGWVGGSKIQEKLPTSLMDGPMPIEQSQHSCWEKVNKYSTFHSGRLRFVFLARKFYSILETNG